MQTVSPNKPAAQSHVKFGVETEQDQLWRLNDGLPSVTHFRQWGFSHVYEIPAELKVSGKKCFMLSKDGAAWVYAHDNEGSSCYVSLRTVYSARDGKTAWLMGRHDSAIESAQHTRERLEELNTEIVRLADLITA